MLFSKQHRFSFAPAVALASLLAATLTGCFNEQPVESGMKTVNVATDATDPRIDFLVAEGGVPRELVYVTYDSIARDTAYIIEPPITPQQKRRGMRGTGVGFRARELDKIIQAQKSDSVSIENGGALAGGVEKGMLTKKAHTRWDHWYASIDIKSLLEVHRVRVYIYPTGPARLGPNWTAAVRSAIANWNAQAKGTAVSFIETNSATDHDISFRGSWGIGSDGSLTSSAFLTADEFMKPDGISLWVNTGYESSATPHNQKTTVAMSLLALSTNITFTGMEGYYWNNGASIHIPGTPATEGDGLTPGSSILTYGTSTVSTPVMTAGDLKTFRTVYPTHGATYVSDAHLGWLFTPSGYKNVFAMEESYTRAYQIASDTVYILREDGKIIRRIGTGIGTPTHQIWPAAGSSGNASEFLYSKGHFAVRTTTGKLYSRTPNGNWVAQTPSATYNPSDFRLDGNRLSVLNTARTHLYSLFLSGNSVINPTLDWVSPGAAITDWQVHNGMLVVVDDGNVWGMQNYLGWHVLHDGTAYGRGYNIRLSDQLMAMYYQPTGLPYYSLAIRHGGIGGWWSYLTDPMYSEKDYDLCNDKVAFLQQSMYLRIIDYTNWIVYAHYTMPTGTNLKAVYLSGANCDHVSVTKYPTYGVYAKYGIDLDNQYMSYGGVWVRFAQKSVPSYNP